jgi:medium-chain acyl-[acyl-carrier-protein] hydrolase
MPLELDVNAWIPRAARPDASYTLICLPYAGGGASIFNDWLERMPPHVQVLPLQLPGREERYEELRPVDVAELVAELSAVLARLAPRRFGLFGHCLGALLSFELARELSRAGRQGPEHLFVSSFAAPDVGLGRPPLHGSSDAEFISELKRLGGIPEGVAREELLLALYLPLLRSDFELIERYRFQPAAPLECPIIGFRGMQDHEVSGSDFAGWSRHTKHSFTEHRFEGGHFFFQTWADSLLARVAAAIPAEFVREAC